MTRLAASLWLDTRLQLRNGFYAAVALVTLFIAAAILQVNAHELAWLVPSLVAGNLVMNPLYFIAGLILLEEQERTLHAQFVAPLPAYTYVLSKILTLSLLVVVENGVVAWLAARGNLELAPFLVGLLLGSIITGLFGLGFVLRYDSINEFILPSVAATTILVLPILDQLGIWEGWAHWFFPMQGPIRLMDAAVRTHTAFDLAASLLVSLAWSGLLLMWCLRRIAHRRAQC